METPSLSLSKPPENQQPKDSKRFLLARTLLLVLAISALILAALIYLWSRPARLSARATLLPATNSENSVTSAQRSSVRLLATNQSASEFTFCCFLEMKTKSGWVDVDQQSDYTRTLQYFRPGQVVERKLQPPKQPGTYRFHCYYEPLNGTPRATRIWERLLGIKLPGKIGVAFHHAVERRQPWPKTYYSNVFTNGAAVGVEPTIQKTGAISTTNIIIPRASFKN